MSGALPYGGIAVYEGVQLGIGGYNDYQRGTTRNSTENIAGAVGATGGAIGGAAGGARIGTLIFPGVGTAIGAVVGATAGGILADVQTRNATGAVFDHWEYDVKILVCKKCGKRYKCRVYTDQSRSCCRKCADEDYDFP